MANKKNYIEGEKTVTSQRTIEVTIKGMCPILFNRLEDLNVPKAKGKDQAKEDPLAKEQRTWRNKLYVNSGQLVIPGENLHQCLQDGAKYWGAKIPGEGAKTYTDVVKSALIVEEGSMGIKEDDARIVPFGKNCNGNPSKGKQSGCRVYKIRPLIQDWTVVFRIHLFDSRLTNDVLQTIFSNAGTFRGLCDWRPVYGRFTLASIEEV